MIQHLHFIITTVIFTSIRKMIFIIFIINISQISKFPAKCDRLCNMGNKAFIFLIPPIVLSYFNMTNK